MLASRLAALPRHRKWLLGILALVILAWGGLVLWQRFLILERPAWEDIDFQAMVEVQLLQEYIAIDTTSGKEAAGAEWLAGKLRQHGIEPQIEKLATGQANLWAVIEGRRPEALVLHHHIDVWPVEEENWSTPPFEGRILGPHLAGRGSFDMKSYGVAQLLAFLDVARVVEETGIRPEYSLILLATADEESGGRLGTGRFLRQHPELVERFWTVLTEGGVTESFEAGEVRYWGVEVGQMQAILITACSSSRQRLEDLAADVRLLPPHQPDLQPAIAAMLRQLSDDRRQPQHAAAMAEPERLTRDRRRFDDLPLFLQVLLADRVEVAEPEEAEHGYSLRMALLRTPGQGPLTDDSALHELLPEHIVRGVSLEVEAFPGPASSALDHPVFRTLTRRLAARGGDAGPYLLSYTATDSREFRAAGITSYGYAPFAFVASGTGPKDRPDERILLTSYVDGVAEYREAVGEVVGVVASGQ